MTTWSLKTEHGLRTPTTFRNGMRNNDLMDATVSLTTYLIFHISDMEGVSLICPLERTSFPEKLIHLKYLGCSQLRLVDELC